MASQSATTEKPAAQRNPPKGSNSAKSESTLRTGWKLLIRSKNQIGNDHLQILAAGVAFYFFLAFFPAIAAFVSIYGILIDPAEVESQIREFASFLPDQIQAFITQVGEQVSARPNRDLGFGIALSIIISIGSANKGAKALFDGLNVAYDQKDRRGFFTKTGLTLLFTFVSVILGLLAVALVAGFPAIAQALPIPESIKGLADALRWPLAAVCAAILISFAYRVAPDRKFHDWSHIKWGAIVATFLWLVGSGLFSFYVSHFNSFGKTYGSFAAIVIFMLWLFMTAFTILVGAEINSELEKQQDETEKAAD